MHGIGADMYGNARCGQSDYRSRSRNATDIEARVGFGPMGGNADYLISDIRDIDVSDLVPSQLENISGILVLDLGMRRSFEHVQR